MDSYWTPSSVNYNRQFGGGLLQQGTDASPVGHWTQALARVLQGGMGGYMMGQANRAEAAGKQGVADIYRQGLERGDGMNKIASALMGNPWGQESGQNMAEKYMLKTAESTGPLATAKLDQIKAHSDLQRAQAQFLRQRGAALNRPQPVAPAEAPKPDPLAGYGIDDNGNIVGPGTGNPAWPSANEAGAAVYGPRPALPPPMRLGGPVDAVNATAGRSFSPPVALGGGIDDIDRSMMPDEGRGRSRGVQVAQAGNYGVGAGFGGPSIVDQARARAGVTSPEVPGIVTDAGRNRRMDVPATREFQGLRALDAATPEQQDRLRKLREDQARWTMTYGRQPRAGYYYGPDGREMALTDKNFKGDREAQAVALMNMNKIESAGDILLGKRTGRVDDKGNPVREQGPYLIERAFGGYANVGDIGQAFADMKQGALGIAYALSGKQVAVAEMKNFIDAYGPQPLDSPERIQAKVNRMRQFYQSLLSASRGGESYETAFARAMAATGITNPDGSPIGQPAAADAQGKAPQPQQGGARPSSSGVRGMTTEELIQRLNRGP